jgi:hypothetical protein
MKTSETIEHLAAALATAQGEMHNAPLNRENPHFRSRYADLAGIRDAVTPALSKNGLSVTQVTSYNEAGNLVLYTRLTHKSGQWIEGEYPITPDKPQQMGSQLTYARRYSLSSICGISADEDDDAEIATKSGNGKAIEPVPSALITNDQIETLQAAIVEVGADLPKMLAYFKITHISDLPGNRYADAMKMLSAKRAKAA